VRPGHFQCVEDLKLCVIYMRHINERMGSTRIFFFFALKIGYFSPAAAFHISYICAYLVFYVAFSPKNTNYNFKLSIKYRL
jgi:hypothetical protein